MLINLLLILKIAPIIAIVIVGANLAADKLLEHFTDKGLFLTFDEKSTLIKSIVYPLFACCTCMSSVWTFVIFWGAYGFEYQLIAQWILTTFAVAYFANIIATLTNKL